MQPVNSPHLLSFSPALPVCLAHTHNTHKLQMHNICCIIARLPMRTCMGPFLSALCFHRPLRHALAHFLIWKRNFATVHFCAFCFSGFKTSLTLFSDFLSLLSFFSLQHILPCSPRHPFLSSPPFHSLSNCVLD